MGPIDRSLKLLCGHFPAEILALLMPGHTLSRIEPVDKELPATTQIVDKAWRVTEGEESWIVHTEFAIHVIRETYLTLFSAAVRLHVAYDTPVQSILLAISEPDALREPLSSYGWQVRGQPRCHYAVDTLCLWHYDAQEALETDSPVAWVLATHMRGGDQAAVLERAAMQIGRLEDQPARVRADLLGILRVLGERRLGDVARILITKELIMGSTLYEEIIADGIEKGIEKGEKKILLRMLQSRFGELPDWLRARLEAITDTAMLEQLADRVLTARSLGDLGLNG